MKKSEISTEQAADLDPTDEFEAVKISDDDLEKSDQLTKHEKKASKKIAKKLRSPDEKKLLKKKRLIFGVGIALILIGIIFGVPATRWPVLNLLGFRGQVTVLVQDQKSFETITDVSVLIDDETVGTTDASGQLRLSNIRLGNHKLKLEKTGYSRFSQNVTVGLGQSQKNTSLEAIGIKVTLGIKDWLTNKPVAGSLIKSEASKATTDKKGQANIIIQPSQSKTKLVISANNYLDRTVMLEPRVTSKDVTLVSSAKDYFISKRDGKYDIFSSNLDGTSQKKIIEATGKENSGLLQFSVNNNNKTAILVANRDGLKKNDRVIAGIYKANLEQPKLDKVDDGSDIRLLGWAGDIVIYTKTIPELDYSDKKFTKIMSYNISTGASEQLAESNYFQVSNVVGSTLFYMPGDAYRELKDVKLEGKNIKTGITQTYLKDKQVSYGVQSGCDVLQIETVTGDYYELSNQTAAATQIDRQPGNVVQCVANKAGNKYLHPETRDGKGDLILSTVGNLNSQKTVLKLGGLTSPVRFVSNDLAVVRIVTNQETADYVVDLGTGKFAKIVDVSNIGFGWTGYN